MPEAGSAPYSYARAGVDRGEVGESLKRLLAETRVHAPAGRGRLLGPVGHYAALVRLGRLTIALTTDTVGTKTLLADELDQWEGVGEDLVAVNANDLAAVGARPSALLDCLSVPRPSATRFAAIGRGIRRGLEASGMQLVGGETAVVPDLVKGYDLGGTAVGFYPPGRLPVTGSAIRPGDLLLGIPSSGVHANGLTLVRRLVRERAVDLSRPRPEAIVPVGEELLRPTRIYVAASEALSGLSDVHGFAHISGGGVRNLVRLKRTVAFVLDQWPVAPPIFSWIAALGALDPAEMFQTFNMGIGFVVVVAARAESAAYRRLAAAGYRDTLVIGRVAKGSGVRVPRFGIEYSGY